MFVVLSPRIIINTIPSQPTQQGGTPQMIPVPMGGGSQSQSSPPMPSYFQIVNSIRISSLLTKLSITWVNQQYQLQDLRLLIFNL